MNEPIDDFCLLEGVLSGDELSAIKKACQLHLTHPHPIPSYVLIDQLTSPLYLKIKAAIEKKVGQELFYFNDFYFYSDDRFQAGWHVDTEFFTFESGINAWVLLSPDKIESPLAIIKDLNSEPDNYYHSLKVEGDQATFANYRSRKRHVMSLEQIEAEKIPAPDVATGDILILNPKRFHKTNVLKPKHVLAIKFLLKGPAGLLSQSQVPAMFWPETKLVNAMMERTESWEDLLAELRESLKTSEGRKTLSDGFFPEKIPLYQKMVAQL